VTTAAPAGGGAPPTRRRFRIPGLRGGGLVLGALIAWNAGNYAFFLIAGRLLGPADYGLVAALLSATLVVAVPAQALQFAVARLVAAPPGGDADLAEGIYARAWRQCALVTPVLAAVACGGILLAAALHSGVPVGPQLVTVALVAPLGFFFLTMGVLQGRERFGGFAAGFALWGVPRPIALPILATFGMGVYAALGATGFALLCALGCTWWLTRAPRPRREPGAPEWRAFARPLIPVTVGLTGLGVLTNLDVIVGKLALDPDEAGRFAAAATLAKAVFLIPQAVSFVLLPRIAARSAADRDTGMILGVAVALTLVAGGLASLAIWALAEPILRITYGGEFAGSADILGAYAAASTLIGALIVVINHHVGRGRNAFIWAVAGIAVLQVVLLAAFHSSAEAIVAVDAVVGAAGIGVHEIISRGSTDAIGPGLVRALARVRLRGRGASGPPETP
jgi:O-antigen/teichoic acid export membrane protein